MKFAWLAAIMGLLVALQPGNTQPPLTPEKAEAKTEAKTEAKAEPAKADVWITPFEAAQIVALDVAAVTQLGSPDLKIEDVRYLSLHNFPQAKERAIMKERADYVLNSLNPRHRQIVRTAGLPVGMDPPLVLRVNLSDYGIPKSAWNSLAEKGSGPVPLPDPYFHEFIPGTLPLAPADKVPWTATVEIGTGKGGTEDKCEIVVNVPDEGAVVSIGGEAMQATGLTRSFVSPALTAKSTYTFRIKGTFNGTPYDVTRRADVTPGGKLTLTVPAVMRVATHLPDKGATYGTARWLAIEPNEADRGSTMTGIMKLVNTKHPILRADWFCVYSTLAPAYYEMIGLELKNNPDPEDAKKNPKVFLEKDFEALFDFDFRIAKVDIVAAIADTKIVTLHNRILQRFNTVKGITGGYFWRSQDTGTGIDDEDYMLNIPSFANPSIAAQEIIASGRNGLNFFALTNNKGVLLNVAVVGIAQHGDKMPTKLQDKQVWAGRNCMICHAGGQIFIKDNVRALAQGNIAMLIGDKSKDAVLSKKIREAFSPDIQTIIEGDNAKYIASVRAATGRDGKVIGAEMENLHWGYLDQPITLDRMARDCGMPPDKLKVALQAGINVHYSLTGVLQNPEVLAFPLTWERKGFSDMMGYLITYKPKK